MAREVTVHKGVTDEFSYWGTNLSTWGDSMTTAQRAARLGWLLEVVLKAFPAMQGYEIR